MVTSRNRVYILISQPDYPNRCAHACLEELERTFVAKAGDQSLSASSHRALNRSCQSLLQKVFQKYDNVAEVDRLSQVNQKVENVKLVMQENVEMALANCVVLENIENMTEDLQNQVYLFILFSLVYFYFNRLVCFNPTHTTFDVRCGGRT